MAAPSIDDHFGPLRAAPMHSIICTDFDGTLAPIVDDPGAARPLDGAVEALVELAGRYGTVAVLSGRPVGFLQAWLPDVVELRGLYGLEAVTDGVRHDHPQARTWRTAVDDVAAVSRAAGLDGMRVEHKGVSVTLHYREHPELAAQVLAFAEVQAARVGLAVGAARMSVELHPPVAVDKGTALLELAAAGVAGGARAACFIGDDAGDLPAFDALDELAATGVATVRVAVRSDEVPEALLRRADVVVDGPAGALALLRRL